MAQKTAKEKKNRKVALCTTSQIPREGRTRPQASEGSRAISTISVSSATAKCGSRAKDSPARYWVVNRLSRRTGRACIMQAERLEYR